MKRREFISRSSAIAIAAALSGLSSELGSDNVLAQSDNSGNSTFQLNRHSDPEVVKEAYQVGGERSLGSSATPYVYALYPVNKFVNPLDATPTTPKGSYTLQPILRSFNIRKADQAKFKKLRKDQVQLGFNATAPISASDQLTWVFQNAVNIFLAKDEQGRQDQLTKFTSSNSQTQNADTALTSTPKITVSNGTVSLQVTAYGQRNNSVFTEIIDAITKVAGSPIVSAASKGFGIPGLATQALSFVDGVLDVVAQQDKLVPLWQTGNLQFAVTADAKATFKLLPGLCAIVDSDYAQKSKFLADHTIDLTYQSYRIVDAAKQPIDANYLVTDITLS